MCVFNLKVYVSLCGSSLYVLVGNFVYVFKSVLSVNASATCNFYTYKVSPVIESDLSV